MAAAPLQYKLTTTNSHFLFLLSGYPMGTTSSAIDLTSLGIPHVVYIVRTETPNAADKFYLLGHEDAGLRPRLYNCKCSPLTSFSRIPCFTLFIAATLSLRKRDSSFLCICGVLFVTLMFAATVLCCAHFRFSSLQQSVLMFVTAFPKTHLFDPVALLNRPRGRDTKSRVCGQYGEYKRGAGHLIFCRRDGRDLPVRRPSSGSKS